MPDVNIVDIRWDKDIARAGVASPNRKIDEKDLRFLNAAFERQHRGAYAV
ncbi:hypothetical protein [Polaromonas sp.]|nr:hypothetical protein [Polaromonas sp.]